MNEQVVQIEGKEINLQQFLKWSAAVASGGEAKIFILEGLVKVNGEIEKRRRRKLNHGDRVEVAKQLVYVVKTCEK